MPDTAYWNIKEDKQTSELLSKVVTKLYSFMDYIKRDLET